MMDGSESDNSKSKLISFEELVKSPILCLENTVKTVVLRVNNLVRQKLAFTNSLGGATKCTLQFDTSASNYKLVDPFME
jgi:hypothetical protein